MRQQNYLGGKPPKNQPNPMKAMGIETCIRLSFFVHDRQVTIVDVTPQAAWLGVFDRFIHKEAKRRGEKLGYDELSTMRDHMADSLNKYDPFRGNIETFLELSALWGYRKIRVMHDASVVRISYNKVKDCGYKPRVSYRIEELQDGARGDGHSGSWSRRRMNDIYRGIEPEPQPDEMAVRNQIRDRILDAVSELPPKQKEVVSRRLLMIADEGSVTHTEDATLEAVGLDLGVSRERVRQIQVDALEALREKLAPVWQEYRGVS